MSGCAPRPSGKNAFKSLAEEHACKMTGQGKMSVMGWDRIEILGKRRGLGE